MILGTAQDNIIISEKSITLESDETEPMKMQHKNKALYKIKDEVPEDKYLHPFSP